MLLCIANNSTKTSYEALALITDRIKYSIKLPVGRYSYKKQRTEKVPNDLVFGLFSLLVKVNIFREIYTHIKWTFLQKSFELK